MKLAKELNLLPDGILSVLLLAKSGFFCSVGWFNNFIETVADVNGWDVRILYLDKYCDIILVSVFSEGFVRKISSLTNYYSPIFTMFFGENRPDKSDVVHFFCCLRKEVIWDVIELRPLSYDECLFIEECASSSGLLSFKYFCFTNWYLHLNGRSYDEYYLGLPSRLRHTIARKSKKFFSIKGARVDIIKTEQGLDKGLMDYYAVYQSSWKCEEPYPDFMKGLVNHGISNGIGRLGVAYIDDKAIAAQYWIVSDAAAYIFKLAYDENYKNYSVGTVLTAKMMAFVIDHDKVNIVDFLTGDDAYKKDWMSHKQDRLGIILFNPDTLLGLIGFFSQKIKYLVKNSIASMRTQYGRN